MTVYVVFERLKAGRLSLDDEFHVSERAWSKQGSKMFVDINSKVSIEDLLRGIIVQSGNDACIVIAEGISGTEEAFAELLNEKAEELGMTGSHFTNASGWPDPDHYMTAHDLAILAEALIREFPEYYPYFAELTFTYHDIKQGNRNPLLYKDLGADGLKTGHTEDAGYGLTASAKRGDRRLVLVVNGLESVQQRADESQRLLEWGFREFDAYTLAAAGDALGEVRVWQGESATVPVAVGKDLHVTLPRDARDRIKASIVYEGPLAAPVEEGAQVATLRLEAPDMKTIEVPLKTTAAVPRLGFFGRVMHSAREMVMGGLEN
jgi:D-alanyl-D-alanine carboxypeptidase (penicillin-binding protein 5/6)